MAIMDMESIEPMVAAASRLLRPGGRFVFSTLHPAFNSGDAGPTVELDLGRRRARRSTRSRSPRTRDRSTAKGVAIPGQPVAQWYFHRPLWIILAPFFDQGFALDALEEPLLRPEHQKPGTPSYVYTELPGVLVARMRRSI